MALIKFRDEDGHMELLWIFAPAVLLGAAALFVTYQFVDPAPPKEITIATGGPNGAYYAYAQRYREILAREGITLNVRTTAGSIENIALLEDLDDPVDIAFVQGGTGDRAVGDNLTSLASLYYEPLWVFLKEGLVYERPGDILGKRISVGPEGSGTRALTMLLLRDAGFSPDDIAVSDFNGEDALNALRNGTLDMMALVASPSSRLVERLLRLDGVHLLNFIRQDAYTRRHRYLTKLTLPEGAVDLSDNLPPENIGLLAATANLVSREDIHPALVDILLLAAEEVHSAGGLFEQPGAFPSPQFLVFPLNDEARRYFTSGPPFLRRTLPFWAATLIDRLALMLLPLIAIVIPLMRIMPPLYKWRVRRRVYRWYKELRKLEHRILRGVNEDEVAAYDAELDRIDDEVRKVRIPWAYAEELYQLRLHIRYVRDELHGRARPRTSDRPAAVSDALESKP